MRYFLENDTLSVAIESHGAEIKSVINKKTGREYIWVGNPSYWGDSSPMLFPIVGCLRDGKYTYKGKTYEMQGHGFGPHKDYTCITKIDSRRGARSAELWFQLKDDEETRAQYPFSFELLVGYVLNGDKLEVIWKVKNEGNEEMYFSVGGHTGFNCPVHGEGKKDGYLIYFEGADEIHHYGNSLVNGLVMNEDLVLPLTDHRLTISDELFQRCTIMIDNRQSGRVRMEDPNRNPIVEMTFDTPMFALWSNDGVNAPYVCIEPWYGRADAEDFNGEFQDKKYMNRLEAGESFKGGYEMQFFAI